MVNSGIITRSQLTKCQCVCGYTINKQRSLKKTHMLLSKVVRSQCASLQVASSKACRAPKETNISSEHSMPKTPNWREADQLISYTRDRDVDEGLPRNIAGLVAGVTLQPLDFEVWRPNINHSRPCCHHRKKTLRQQAVSYSP